MNLTLPWVPEAFLAYGGNFRCCYGTGISAIKSAFSLLRILRCQIFTCEDWQFGVLPFPVLFAWDPPRPAREYEFPSMTKVFMKSWLVYSSSAKQCLLSVTLRASPCHSTEVNAKNSTTQHARHRKCERLPRIATLKFWPTYLISFTVQYCFLFRFACIELVSLIWMICSNLSCNVCLWYYD